MRSMLLYVCVVSQSLQGVLEEERVCLFNGMLVIRFQGCGSNRDVKI